MKLDFVAPKAVGSQTLTLFFMCDSYMGCDQVRVHNGLRGMPTLGAQLGRLSAPCSDQARTCPLLQEFELELDVKEGAGSDDEEQAQQMDQD